MKSVCFYIRWFLRYGAFEAKIMPNYGKLTILAQIRQLRRMFIMSVRMPSVSRMTFWNQFVPTLRGSWDIVKNTFFHFVRHIYHSVIIASLNTVRPWHALHFRAWRNIPCCFFHSKVHMEIIIFCYQFLIQVNFLKNLFEVLHASPMDISRQIVASAQIV